MNLCLPHNACPEDPIQWPASFMNLVRCGLMTFMSWSVSNVCMSQFICCYACLKCLP